MDSKQKGNLTELRCLTAFVELGCTVSIPYGDNARYDFIAEVNKHLYKIQVKTSCLKKNTEDAIYFSCRSTVVNCSGIKRSTYSEEDVDFFATYWEGKCYLIPRKECSSEKTLRFAPPKNGQTVGITFAKDYELEKQINLLTEVKN